MDAVPAPYCLPFEYDSAIALKNNLGVCYRHSGTEKMRDGSSVEIWNRSPDASRTEYGPVPRMMLHVRKDRSACIYLKVYIEKETP